MTAITKKAINVTLLVSLLMSLSACAVSQGAPSMMDYSYVPPSNVLAPAPMPTLEDY